MDEDYHHISIPPHEDSDDSELEHYNHNIMATEEINTGELHAVIKPQ